MKLYIASSVPMIYKLQWQIYKDFLHYIYCRAYQKVFISCLNHFKRSIYIRKKKVALSNFRQKVIIKILTNLTEKR